MSDSVLRRTGPISLTDTPLEPSICRTLSHHATEKFPEMKKALPQRCSSGLSLQLFGVETRSFLPQGQSDTGDLARQGETSHSGTHSTFHPGDIKITQWTRACAGRNGRTFEQALQVFIVIIVQTAHRNALAVALQRFITRVVFRARSGTRRCRASPPRNHCRPTAGAWCGNDAGSAAGPPVKLPESD